MINVPSRVTSFKVFFEKNKTEVSDLFLFSSHVHNQKSHLFLLTIQVIYACFFIIYESIFIL
ncbi:hypothetical protein BMQ_pBM50093 (plasmid) [Priestia megaterium QM B1551]|uniref:Uncharacterized protein n=1 Tax=Priestia megaterium (strain ATCC 12872 / QMB1551) TaxID=545693 RepID=D5E3Q7_PRIM1|nr:hypothetical protein BMQ_pBM50093 [Priestia megaterium QM B1551]